MAEALSFTNKIIPGFPLSVIPQFFPMNISFMPIIFLMHSPQSMMAVRMGVQKISGIKVSDAQTADLLDTLPDMEVSNNIDFVHFHP